VRRALLISLAAAFALPAAAEAKSCVRIAISDARPSVGQLVMVRMTLWMPRWENGKAVLVERMDIPRGSVFRSRVVSLRGAPSFEVRYRRDPTRPRLAMVRFRFPSAGTWTIDPPSGWAWAPRGCANGLRVRVTT
jgi:hypothetical protein